MSTDTTNVGVERDQEEDMAVRVCVDCNKQFEPQRSDARTCSGACRQRAYRRRVAERDTYTANFSAIMRNPQLPKMVSSVTVMPPNRRIRISGSRNVTRSPRTTSRTRQAVQRKPNPVYATAKSTGKCYVLYNRTLKRWASCWAEELEAAVTRIGWQLDDCSHRIWHDSVPTTITPKA